MSKKYYWLKLKNDFFEDDTIQFIEEQENGYKYVNFYLKLCLKSLKSDGTLIRLVGETLIPYDVKSLAKLTNTDVDIVRVAMDLFKKIGLIKVYDSGEIYLTQIKEMIGSETEKAQIMRKTRARKSIGNNVTRMLPECYTEIEKEKDIDIEIDKEIEKEKRKTFKGVIDSYTSYQPLKDSLNAYVDMRKKMKGYTIQALELNLKELDKLAIDDDTKMSIVNQSISHTWKGFYELKLNVSEPVYTSDNNISVSDDEINKYVGGKYE